MPYQKLQYLNGIFEYQTIMKTFLYLICILWSQRCRCVVGLITLFHQVVTHVRKNWLNYTYLEKAELFDLTASLTDFNGFDQVKSQKYRNWSTRFNSFGML